jgi:hypothetical protein
VVSDFCPLVPPHKFSEQTLTFFDTDDPAVSADRKWSADVLKTRRCLCTENKANCPDGTEVVE